MKLIDLISSVDWDDVAKVLVEIDKDDGNLDGYKKVYGELKTLKPQDSDFVIHIEHDKWDEDEWEEVYGIRKKDGEKYGLDFTPWEEMLGMEVDEGTVEKYSKTGVAAHCIWEMTFYGFTQKEIQKKLKRIEKRCEEPRPE